MTHATGRTLVIGIGNPILGDDAVGWRVADEVRARLGTGDGVDVEQAALGGLALMERMIGYERALIVDAVCTGSVPLGTVCCWPLASVPAGTRGYLGSAHDTSLSTALAMGRAIGATLPADVTVIGIETSGAYDFSESLAAPVAAAVPVAVAMVIDGLLAASAQDDFRLEAHHGIS